MKEISTSEAVRRFAMHPITVLRLIQTGKLKARKNENGHWQIEIASLERWDRERKRRQRKPEASK